jgi:hypothetical protein
MPCSSKSMLLFSFAIVAIALQASAFSPTVRTVVTSHTHSRPILYSSGDSSESSENTVDPATFPTQPPVPQKRLDPLMATLTRMDPEAIRGPTRNVPLFGEVPVDGGLVVLVPAAVIALLGFILSIVVAVNSSDELVAALSNVADDIAQTASQKTNMVYDEGVCRGICSSQEEDLQGLAKFMESLRK